MNCLAKSPYNDGDYPPRDSPFHLQIRNGRSRSRRWIPRKATRSQSLPKVDWVGMRRPDRPEWTRGAAGFPRRGEHGRHAQFQNPTYVCGVRVGSPLRVSASLRLCVYPPAELNAETQRRGGAERGLEGNGEVCCHEPFVGDSARD
jgi:hypothetical protein